MKITLITIGSTGDVRPYTILGKELKRRGHQVRIAAFGKFENMAANAGLDFYPISGSAMNFIDDLMKPGAKGVKYLLQVVKSLKDSLNDMLQDMENACEGSDAMVCTFFGSMYYSIAEKYGIPCIQTEYFPIDSHPLVPMSSAPGQHLGKIWNLLTYRIGHLLISVLEKIYLSKWRKKIGVSKGKISTKPDYKLNGGTIPVIYAMSEHVFPRSPYWDEHFYLSGFWFDEDKTDFTPSREMEKFLNGGKSPVYIGFGSMVSGDMKKTFAIVVEAVKKTGIRAVIDGGWAEDCLAEESSSNIFVLHDFVPHDWLFPRMQAVVHHGGAGTTAAAIKAARPMLIIPFGGDQPFWGGRICACGCGPEPIGREKLNATNLSKALTELVTEEKYAENARNLAEKIAAENGTKTAADIIENEIRKWNSKK